MRVLQTRCVQGIKADADRARELLDRSTAVATALSPYIGYAATADIAKTSVQTGRSVRDLVRERGLVPDDELDAILAPDAMTSPGIPGGMPPVHRPDKEGASVHRIVPIVAALLVLTPPAAGQQRSTEDSSRRKTWTSSKGRIATCGSVRTRSWTRSASPKAASSLIWAPAADGSRSGSRDRVRPNGKVYAEDIQPQMIEVIKRRVVRENLQRIVETKLGTADDPKLPPDSLDAVLIVDTYHEMEQPVALLRNVARALKTTGRIGIVDFTMAGGGPGPPMDERVDPERVIREADAAGLRLIARPNFLRYQFMLVFGKPDASTRRAK